MSTELSVNVYYGPLSWFRSKTESKNCDYLLDLVNELDSDRRKIIHVVENSNANDGTDLPQDDSEATGPEIVVVESSDYSSLQEHAIANFVGLVRSIGPESLILHNPPIKVQEQLQREYDVHTHYYEYPAINRLTLKKFSAGFDSHMVGQISVRNEMLAAMYPLTRSNRKQPVVLMFYGPSGVGKTQTAQFVNELLGGSLFRKQFSMFNSDRFASYVFGGNHSESSFAHDLLDRDSGVILIDEFDKSNAVFHSAFYELFDGGRFEDKNYVVNVGPALIICTSNYNSTSEIRDSLGEALFSRFDAHIRFSPLSIDEVRQVMKRLIDQKVESLDDDERDALDMGKLSQAFEKVPSKLGNIRQLKKIVDQTIYLLLVRSLLTDEQSTDNNEEPQST